MRRLDWFLAAVIAAFLAAAFAIEVAGAGSGGAASPHRADIAQPIVSRCADTPSCDACQAVFFHRHPNTGV